MNLEDIKKYFDENKDNEEVKAYLGELSAVSPDKVKGFLNTDEGKRLIQPDLDRYHNKSLESWKSNNLESIIEEEVKKRNPEKTPEQLKIEELEKKIEKAEKDRIRGELVNKAFKVADEKSLPKDVIDFFIGENEDATLENLEKFEQSYTTALQKAVDERFKAGGREVPGGDKTDNSVGANFAKSANQPAAQTEEKTIWD